MKLASGAQASNLLRLTMLDVDHGDCLLVERETAAGCRTMVVDSTAGRSPLVTWKFIRDYYQRKRQQTMLPSQLIHTIVVTHDDADHTGGLQQIIKNLGAHTFIYPSTYRATSLPLLVRQVRRYHPRVRLIAADTHSTLSLGDVVVKVLWPPPLHQPCGSNDNSLVLALTLGTVTFVLAGDAEPDTWQQMPTPLPATTSFLKLPHHGAYNSVHDTQGARPLLDHFKGVGCCPSIGVSCHFSPHRHPNGKAIDALEAAGLQVYRTDRHGHVVVETDGTSMCVRCCQ